MNLQAELETLSNKIESEMPQVHNSIQRVIAGLKNANMISRGPKVGDNVVDFTLKNIYNGKDVGEKIEDFSLPNPWGEQICLGELLKKGPVVLNFYRGNWCPFCTMEMRALVKISPKISQLGANLVAISLEKPEETEKTLEIIEMKFIVLSDIDAKVSKQFGLVYEAPAHNKMSMELNLIDLASHNDSQRALTVIPATYVIDRNFEIKFAFSDEDFRRRVNTSDVLDSLRSLN